MCPCKTAEAPAGGSELGLESRCPGVPCEGRPGREMASLVVRTQSSVYNSIVVCAAVRAEGGELVCVSRFETTRRAVRLWRPLPRFMRGSLWRWNSFQNSKHTKTSNRQTCWCCQAQNCLAALVVNVPKHQIRGMWKDPPSRPVPLPPALIISAVWWQRVDALALRG